ncbi:Cytochrome bo(3) ubiquinol oxidase subunit 4 [Candidatus Erwinia haradaeae]|uniref:Cytochrome bo(3) ubiquinol oxidase subunit 4 n=1 Tax=Candidatus Erwinia haradaeae TaxID=1922217 RepID=A0A451DDC1_9GAMM|nr:cytochrome o ubiquinol oxidase subunit IV [Candidatus Erwinia haradaeae]VFP84473.1 Cytochrome bo(3) ubiquinol oxidase subunit 4 [Candidatus Erwinia haradaeae]
MSDTVKKYNCIPKDLKSYLIGFLVSVVLTVIPFWMVMNHIGSQAALLSLVLICAIMQIIIHLVYFLHLDSKSEGGWNLIAISFATLIILIIIIGSLWIMWNLNYNMRASLH